MVRKIYSILLLLFCSFGLINAQSSRSIRYNFDSGIPENFTLIDADGNVPSADVGQYGFDVGIPWVSHYLKEEDNYVAASTSWYAQSGTSDDWMILPAFTVETADDVIAWRARATDEFFSDGYAVYVLDAESSSIDADKLEPIFAVTAEKSEWAYHSVSLAEYMGRTVRIAFVNNSTDCSLLYVDDIMIGEPAVIRFEHTMRPLVKPSDEVVIQGNISTDLAEPVQGFTLGFERNGVKSEKSFMDVSVLPGALLPVSVQSGDTLPAGSSMTYKIWVEAGGKRYDTQATVSSHYNKVVSEELTGTWCGWCIRGIVSLEEMKELYPESFIGIAVHSGDFLEADGYAEYIKDISASTGFPYSITCRDRSAAGDPAKIPTFYERKANADIKGCVDLELSADDEECMAKSNVVLNENISDGRYRMSYVIVENDVFEEQNPNYRQLNYYAGGENGPMGGYEDMPELLVNYHFNDVARGIIGDVSGIDESLPYVMDMGKEYTHEVTFSLPQEVINPDNVYIVAMLIDGRNGSIVNADMKKLTLEIPSVITDVDAGLLPDSQDFYSIDGRKVTANDHTPGIYIQRTVKDGKMYVKKFIVK